MSRDLDLPTYLFIYLVIYLLIYLITYFLTYLLTYLFLLALARMLDSTGCWLVQIRESAVERRS